MICHNNIESPRRNRSFGIGHATNKREHTVKDDDGGRGSFVENIKYDIFQFGSRVEMRSEEREGGGGEREGGEKDRREGGRKREGMERGREVSRAIYERKNVTQIFHVAARPPSAQRNANERKRASERPKRIQVSFVFISKLCLPFAQCIVHCRPSHSIIVLRNLICCDQSVCEWTCAHTASCSLFIVFCTFFQSSLSSITCGRPLANAANHNYDKTAKFTMLFADTPSQTAHTPPCDR